jgi:hypothetical protein
MNRRVPPMSSEELKQALDALRAAARAQMCATDLLLDAIRDLETRARQEGTWIPRDCADPRRIVAAARSIAES